MPHYHIRWSTTGALDWEIFDTRAEAYDAAKLLVRRGETYTVERFDLTCARCRDAMKKYSKRA